MTANWGDGYIGKISQRGWHVSVAPTVTNGAYSAGDVMGGLMEFSVGPEAPEVIIIDAIQVALKSAVTPSLTLVILTTKPASTNLNDNDPYSLAVADVFKVRCVIPINSLGGFMMDHGTPNTFHLGNLELPISMNDTNLYAYLIDNTGVTLTSTSDVQVTLSGRGA